MRPTALCPCGSDEPFGRCCLPLHLGERQAETAEQLMRARYSAYAVDDLDYIWQTLASADAARGVDTGGRIDVDRTGDTRHRRRSSRRRIG